MWFLIFLVSEHWTIWWAATYGYSQRETKQRSAEFCCCVSRSCRNPSRLGEKWMVNAPSLASGPVVLWLQLYNRGTIRTASNGCSQQPSCESLCKSLCAASHVVQQKHGRVPGTRCSCRSIVPKVKFYVKTHFGQHWQRHPCCDPLLRFHYVLCHSDLGPWENQASEQ